MADQLLGTNMYKGPADSVGDMAATAAGSAGGGLLLVAWAERGWGTSRRLPLPAQPATSPRPRSAEEEDAPGSAAG